jgi:hypothetical protein
MPAATAAPKRASSDERTPFIRAHWSISATLLLLGAVAFSFFVPLRVCEPCRGLGTQTMLSLCRTCQGDGRQTAWDIYHASRQTEKVASKR